MQTQKKKVKLESGCRCPHCGKLEGSSVQMWLANTAARAGCEHIQRREVFPKKMKFSCELLHPLRKHLSNSCFSLPSYEILLSPFSLIQICKPRVLSLLSCILCPYSLSSTLLPTLILCLEFMLWISPPRCCCWSIRVKQLAHISLPYLAFLPVLWQYNSNCAYLQSWYNYFNHNRFKIIPFGLRRL